VVNYNNTSILHGYADMDLDDFGVTWCHRSRDVRLAYCSSVITVHLVTCTVMEILNLEDIRVRTLNFFGHVTIQFPRCNGQL